MARTTTRRTAPEPIVSLDEIDEALWWTSHQRERNSQWHRWLDALLDERNRLTATEGQQTNQQTPCEDETEQGT